jgi:hypothetical protein
MSVFSLKRVFFAVLATAVLASNAFAVNPSPRSYTRMAWDSDSGQLIAFGGASPVDNGTLRPYDSNETWAWTGSRWAQRFPATSPSGRTAHYMVHDSTRGRVVLFGGRQATGGVNNEFRLLNDTWVYDNGNWSEITAPNTPTPRQHGAMAYDPVRDRVVIFGGTTFKADGVTLENNFETWELDGTTWVQASYNTPELLRPMLAWDKRRSQMILVGSDTAFKPKMYRLDAQASLWNEVTPEKMPDCVSDASMVYQDHNALIVLVGGVCSVTTAFVDQTWEWNGTTWAENKTKTPVTRATATALGYDQLRATSVLFGGFIAFESLPRSTTQLYRDGNWSFPDFQTRPTPRSLFTFVPDPVNQTVWLLGGLDEYNSSYLADVWGYRGGQFFTKKVTGIPATCEAPTAAFDTDRNKMVFACWPTTSLDVEIYEFDGNEFKNITTTKDKPEARRFSTLVYDASLKKIVLFGGYDLQNFKDDTWTWDGANWTEVKRDKPPNRALHTMWYDPIQKRTILYGGIGRESIEEKVQRFSDMWAFTGNGWTKLNVTNTPGERLGPQYAIDPATGKLLLFGGLKAELTDPSDEDSLRRQFYDNETWQWDGGASTWTKLTPATSPAARQNGRLAYDPLSQRLVLFGGYAGFFFSDIWSWTGTNWEVVSDQGGGRRRSAGGGTTQPPTGND